ncbi:MAG: DUF6178 family protein [Nitrospinae bacterium]|nr:DUF6178 family protein [Nitrospinota bacterium]MDA1110322.1 DUF6178 family protein [Nitrospinota bacterium]
MTKIIDHFKKTPVNRLPFPLDWISRNPREVEKILSQMSVEDQARCVTQCPAEQKQNLLTLSEQAEEVVHALPPEEIYQMVKAIGEGEALPVLFLVNCEQMQFIFDMEWWVGDKFQPKRALDWIVLLDKCDESQTLEWLMTEEFDQKVMLMQALFKVYKQDEMTDSYEGTEELEHFTPDGVYDIFFKIQETGPIRKLLLLLWSNFPSVFNSLMEAVIWYPLTETVEKAYHWRMTRISDRGFPEIEEALGVYSPLDVESIKLQVPDAEDFSRDGDSPVPPQYMLAEADSSTFFGQCVALLMDGNRLDAIHWELVCLANKVMVADREDPADFANRGKVFRKVLGYINIALDLAAEGDPQKGKNLLERSWMRFLFQAGYHRLMSLKWKAESFLKEQGTYLDPFLTPFEKEQLTALIHRFPQVLHFAEEEDSIEERNFETLDDILGADALLSRWVFMVRFSRKCLDLTENAMSQILIECDFPENKSNMDFTTWMTTALARFSLFKEISCAPLPEVAAKSFLEVIFLPKIFNDEGRVCHEDIVQAFHDRLLQTPLAWTDENREFLKEFIQRCVQNLEEQFGSLDLKSKIDWKYTHGLCLKL